MRCEEPHTIGDQLGSGLVTTGDQQQTEPDDLRVGELLAVELDVDEQAEDVVGRAFPSQRHQLDRERDQVAGSCVALGRYSHHSGLAGEELVGPHAHVVVLVRRDAEHRGDHGCREARCEVARPRRTRCVRRGRRRACRVHSRTLGSSSAMRRGVNRRETSLRTAVWSGGSRWIIEPAGPSGP